MAHSRDSRTLPRRATPDRAPAWRTPAAARHTRRLFAAAEWRVRTEHEQTATLRDPSRCAWGSRRAASAPAGFRRDMSGWLCISRHRRTGVLSRYGRCSGRRRVTLVAMRWFAYALLLGLAAPAAASPKLCKGCVLELPADDDPAPLVVILHGDREHAGPAAERWRAA